MIAPEYFNNHVAVEGEIIVKSVPNDAGFVLVWNPTTKKISRRTHAELISDMNLMTTNTEQTVYGTKYFVTADGNESYNNTLIVIANDGSYPAMSFYDQTYGFGQVKFALGTFKFTDYNGTDFVDAKAYNFFTDNFGSADLWNQAYQWGNHKAINDNQWLGYVSGGQEKPNSPYFGAGKLKLQMLSGSNLGTGNSLWHDVLWMSSYIGGDVPLSTAIISSKQSNEIGFTKQDYNAPNWGTYYKFWTTANFDPNNYATSNQLGDYVRKFGDTMSGALKMDASVHATLNKDMSNISASNAGGFARDLIRLTGTNGVIDVLGWLGTVDVNGNVALGYGYLGGVAYNTKNAIRWNSTQQVRIGSDLNPSGTYALEVDGTTYSQGMRVDGDTNINGMLNITAPSMVGYIRGVSPTGNYLTWAKSDGSKAIAYIGSDMGSAGPGGIGENFVIRSPSGDIQLYSDVGIASYNGSEIATKNWVNATALINNGDVNNLHTQENNYLWINGAITGGGQFTNWTGSFLAFGTINLGHKSQFLVSKTDVWFRTEYGDENSNFIQLAKVNDLTNFPTYSFLAQNYALRDGSNATSAWIDSSFGLSPNPAIEGKTMSALGTVYLNEATYGQIAGYINSSGIANGNPTDDWHYRMKFLHNNPNGYYGEIAVQMTGANALRYKRFEEGTDHGWIKVWDEQNFNPVNYIPRAFTQVDTFNAVPNSSFTSIYRSEYNLNGVKYAYSPMLHLGGGDTMSQLQINYNNGSPNSGELSYRGGSNNSFGEWRTAWDNVNMLHYNTYGLGDIINYMSETNGFQNKTGFYTYNAFVDSIVGIPLNYGNFLNLSSNGQIITATYDPNALYFRSRSESDLTNWTVKKIWHDGNFNPDAYVLQSVLNTQLGNYATLAGVQTFTNTNTFNQSPVIPHGTLGAHAVNLNQLNGKVTNLENVTGVGFSSGNADAAPYFYHPVNGYRFLATQVWISQNYIPTSHIANTIALTNILQWNDIYNYGLRLNQQFTVNTGNEIAIVDDYNGGESGLYDIQNSKMIAGRDGSYYKYGSGYGLFDGLNFAYKPKLFGIGREIGNDEDKVQLSGNISADTTDIFGSSIQLILNPLYTTDGDVHYSRHAHVYIVTRNTVRLPDKPILGQRIEIFNDSDSDIEVTHGNVGTMFYVPGFCKVTGIAANKGFKFDAEPISTKQYDI